MKTEPENKHLVEETPSERLKAWIPFGIGSRKPRHFLDMGKIAWENKSNPGYAWKVLSKGVCDGCALGVAGFKDWTISGTHLCMTRLNLLRLNTMGPLDPALLQDVSKLEGKSNKELRKLGRLPYPMIRKAGDPGFHRITWEEAYTFLGDKIRNLPHRDRMALFLTSRGVTNEIYYMGQKVARFLGTNNVDNAARICHSPSTAAMKATLGVAASTCSYSDWFGTDLIIFFGSNPANDQPVATKYLHEAKARGTKVVMVNPYMEPGMKRYWVPSTASSALFGTKIADYWYPVAQGGDLAFLTGVARFLVEKDALNHDFLEKHVDDLDTFKAWVKESSWDRLEQESGLGRDSMEAFADLLAGAKNAVLIWSMGITQHAHGAENVQMILNIGLLRGYLGRDKNGLMPIRGHSSVQGGAEMGAYATAFPGGKPITPENARELEAHYGFPIPDKPGLTTTEMVEQAWRGEIDLLYALGGNFLRVLPEPDHVREALARTPVRVHQDIILTDQMFIPAREAVLLLPAATRYEQEGGGAETTTERRVIFSPEIPRQVGEARSEWRILRELAVAVDPSADGILGCRTGQEIREEIAKVVPIYDGIQHLRKTGDAFQYGGPHLCADGVCPTPNGKARLNTVQLPARGEKPNPDFPFKVSTRRGKQFNSLIYAEVDPLTGAPRDAVFMNPDDAAELHLVQGDKVELVNDLGRITCRVFLAPISPKNLQVHWPEGNAIIRKGVVDSGGMVPDYNACVRIERLHTPTPAAALP